MRKNLRRLFYNGTGLLGKRFDRLGQDVGDQAKNLLNQPRDEWPLDDIHAALHKHFGLTEMSVDSLTNVTVSLEMEPHISHEGRVVNGHFAEITLPYSGSAIFLRVRPARGFLFRYKAKVGTTAVKLVTYLPSLDPTGFVADAQQEVAALHDAQAEFKPEMSKWCDAFKKRIDGA